MGGKRKNQKRAASMEQGELCLEEGHGIMRVMSLRGSNVIEVVDAKGIKSLALFPAKFQKSVWIRRGSFVVVDESGRAKALESGSKVACIVLQILFPDQVRVLQKAPEWPEIFRATESDDTNNHLQKHMAELDVQSDPEEDDGLPPLEANLNRIRPMELYSDSDTDSKPEIFRATESDDTNNHLQKHMANLDVQSDPEDDDGLPPLEANLNRDRPMELYSDSDTDSK